MHLKDFKREIAKRSDFGIEYEIGAPATESELQAAELRLGVPFYEQIRRFYLFCNGFVVLSPHFDVLRIQDLDYLHSTLIHFCTVDHCHPLCFDTSHKNEAEQWFIVDAETGFRVAYTMASIWSNKVWARIDRGKPIWKTL